MVHDGYSLPPAAAATAPEQQSLPSAAAAIAEVMPPTVPPVAEDPRPSSRDAINEVLPDGFWAAPTLVAQEPVASTPPTLTGLPTIDFSHVEVREPGPPAPEVVVIDEEEVDQEAVTVPVPTLPLVSGEEPYCAETLPDTPSP